MLTKINKSWGNSQFKKYSPKKFKKFPLNFKNCCENKPPSIYTFLTKLNKSWENTKFKKFFCKFKNFPLNFKKCCLVD